MACGGKTIPDHSRVGVATRMRDCVGKKVGLGNLRVFNGIFVQVDWTGASNWGGGKWGEAKVLTTQRRG